MTQILLWEGGYGLQLEMFLKTPRCRGPRIQTFAVSPSPRRPSLGGAVNFPSAPRSHTAAAVEAGESVLLQCETVDRTLGG